MLLVVAIYSILAVEFFSGPPGNTDGVGFFYFGTFSRSMFAVCRTRAVCVRVEVMVECVSVVFMYVYCMYIICVFACMNVCVYIGIYICMGIYLHIFIHIYTCIYIYICI